ncbi:MAG: hypothetical protein WBQ50_00995 [Nocardioides sp.]
MAETLWAAARPEDLLYVNVEIERLRSALGALQATVVVEVEVSDPPEERWIRRCRRASEQWCRDASLLGSSTIERLTQGEPDRGAAL